MENNDRPKNSFRFFQNKECEFFPCHETKHPETFNCLFCYCPLYALGEKCGGNYQYLNSGIKDCSKCMVPHGPNGYNYITSKYFEIMMLAKRDPDKKEIFEIVTESEENQGK